MISDARGTAIFEIAKIAVQDPFPIGEAIKSRDLLNAMLPKAAEKMSAYKTEDLTNFLAVRKTSFFKIFKRILVESYKETLEDYENGTEDFKKQPKKFSDASILSEPLIRYLQSHDNVLKSVNNYKRLVRHVAHKLDLTNDIIQNMIAISKNPILKEVEELSLEARALLSKSNLSEK